MRHVSNIDHVALNLIMNLQSRLADSGNELVICNAGLFADDMIGQGIDRKALFIDDDSALEYSENGLLLSLLNATELRPTSVSSQTLFFWQDWIWRT